MLHRPCIVGLVALLCALVVALPAWGATSADLQRLLAGVDPAWVPSGILLDRVVTLSDLRRFDGGPTAPVASAASWRQMLHELSRASTAPPPWPSAEDARQAGRATGVIPLAVLDVDYEKLHADALERGAARVVGGRLELQREAVTRARAFAASALRPSTHRGESVSFRLDDAWWLGNRPAPASLQVDFDDGSGWRSLPIGGVQTVRYPEPGPKTLRLRARYADGTEKLARFGFDVLAMAAPAPDDTLQVTASVAYLGEAATGQAYVYLAEAHATITRPVVVIEGFDIDDSLYWEELYALLNQENLLEDLRAEGYDAVVLDFDAATTYLQRNAHLVTTLLEQVRAAIDPSTDIVLVGASMGGLLGRYALAQLESQGTDLGVRSFISFDAPHHGANIPLGIQYWLDFFQDESADAAFLLSRLDSPAARQMLLVHHTTPPSTTGDPDPLRTDFVADLAAVGDWPSLPRKVAVANGSSTQLDQGFAAAAQIIRWEYDSFLVDITGNCWALPDGVTSTIFDGRLAIFLIGTQTQTVNVGATSPWDNAPGGWRASMAQMDSVQAPYGDIVALYSAHAFVPTISALALTVTDPFFDVAGEPDLLALTPLDAVYFPVENQEHVLITPESKMWFLAEIEGLTPVAPVVSAGLRLLPSTPNPFNPATNVRFELDAPSKVTVEIFDVRGRRVDTLLEDAALDEGRHTIVWRPGDLASGVYRLRVRAGEHERRGRVTLLK